MARWKPTRRPDVVPLDGRGAAHGRATELAQDESAHRASAGRGQHRHRGVAILVADRARDGCCADVGGTVRRVSDDGPSVPRGCGRGAIPDGPAADVSWLGSHCDPPPGGPHPRFPGTLPECVVGQSPRMTLETQAYARSVRDDLAAGKTL